MTDTEESHTLREQIKQLEARNRQLETQLRQQSKALEHCKLTNKAKSEFLANMSHELRNPMHGILSYAAFGVLRSHKLPRAKLHEYFQEIGESGNRLMCLLNDLLDLAKLESGKMHCNMTKQDICTKVIAVIHEFRPLLEEHALCLETDFQQTPWVTSFDACRISQVLRNLLTNAIKFSPKNSTIYITIEEELRARDESNTDSVLVSIRDHGLGIPEPELDAVFEEFTQGSRNSTDTIGTGLGLAISKQIISAHQGKIWVENHPEGGAQFFFTLPQSNTLQQQE